jgi:hypothetical protein
MEAESSGDDLEVEDETVSMKDLTLGSMDVSFLQPEEGAVQWLQDFDQVLKGCNLKKYDAEDIKKIVRYFTEKKRVPEALPARFEAPEVSPHLPCITFDGLTNKGKGFTSRILWFMTLLQDKHQNLHDVMTGMKHKSKKQVVELILDVAKKLLKYLS